MLIAGRWVALEGVILDRRYLEGVRAAFPDQRGAFLGYGVGTENLSAPENDFRGTDTYIQRTGINQDFGIFDDPDSFYASRGANLSGIKRLVFRRWIRRAMNARVAGIRTSVGR